MGLEALALHVRLACRGTASTVDVQQPAIKVFLALDANITGGPLSALNVFFKDAVALVLTWRYIDGQNNDLYKGEYMRYSNIEASAKILV